MLKENPPDIASRGLSNNELTQCNLWWNRPDWLKNHPASWPIWDIETINQQKNQNNPIYVKSPKVLYEIASINSTLQIRTKTKTGKR